MKAVSELSFLIAVLLGFCSSSVRGLKIPFEVYRRDSGLATFTSTKKQTLAFDGTSVQTIDNKFDIRYTTNITINGKEIVVALDTGSTDLWANPPGGVGKFNDTGIPVQLDYGDGSYGVTGTVGVGPFKFSSYEVPQQAFLAVQKSTTSLGSLGISGLLGLSFDVVTSSPIGAAVKQKYGSGATWGQSVLHNIFDQHPTEPNFVAISLSRTDDLEDTSGGSFSIGEYNPTFSAIAQEPQLPQFPDGGDRWTTLLEGISVDGHSIPVTSTMDKVPAGHGVALLDTGDPAAMFPTAVWDGIYGSIPGAVKINDAGGAYWVIPCNTTTIVELVFGGQKYAIHPLDLTTISKPRTVDGQAGVSCVSAFRASDAFAAQGFEYSLGDCFLRNVYTAYHFGDTTSNGKPYMQLLSRVDPQKVTAQVATVRAKTMASLPPEIPTATLQKLVDGSGTGAPATSSAGVANLAVDTTSGDSSFGGIDREDLKTYALVAMVLLATNLLVGLVLISFQVLNCVRRGSDKRKRNSIPGVASTHYVPVGLDDDVYSANQKYGD